MDNNEEINSDNCCGRLNLIKLCKSDNLCSNEDKEGINYVRKELLYASGVN